MGRGYAAIVFRLCATGIRARGFRACAKAVRSRRCRARCRPARFFYFTDRQEKLVALVRRLGPLVEQHGSPAQHLDFLHLRGQQAYREERYALSEALVRETYAAAAELDDPSADFTIGFCLLWRGKTDEAERHLMRGRDVAHARGLTLLETRCRVYGSVARRRLNDVERARVLVHELDSQDELHGYRGLTAAVAAWIAYRDGDLELAAKRGEEALADWEPEGRGGSGVFGWTARFPLVGVELARERAEAALEHARALLDPALQPLPPEIGAAVERAVRSGRPEDLRAALEIARPSGYA